MDREIDVKKQKGGQNEVTVCMFNGAGGRFVFVFFFQFIVRISSISRVNTNTGRFTIAAFIVIAVAVTATHLIWTVPPGARPLDIHHYLVSMAKRLESQ